MTTQKFNIFRIPFLMERMAQSSMTAALDATYFGALQDIVKYITEKNATAVLDAQNFGRYKGAVFNNAADFKTFWTNIATPFKNESRVVFDWSVFCSQAIVRELYSYISSNNEFHDEPVDTVAQMNQACIDGVRAAGATSQYVFVEGTVKPALSSLAYTLLIHIVLYRRLDLDFLRQRQSNGQPQRSVQ